MVDFMERNGDLNKPAGGPHSRLYNLTKWDELAAVLNVDNCLVHETQVEKAGIPHQFLVGGDSGVALPSYGRQLLALFPHQLFGNRGITYCSTLPLSYVQ